METFEIKRGALWPPIEATINLNRNGNLTGCTVRLRIKNQDGTIVSEYDAVVSDAAGGVVTYAWVPGNTDIAGNWWLEYWITLPDGTMSKLPTDGYVNIMIADDIHT